MINEDAPIEKSGSKFGNLTDPAGDGILMALATGLRVVDGPKTLLDVVLLNENFPIQIELCLTYKPIGLIVESCRSFRQTALTNSGTYSEQRQNDDENA